MRWPVILCIVLGLVLPVEAETSKIVGEASWYGGGERLNKHTANGERFDPSKMTAAMWDVPLGTMVRVTNLSTGKSVIVRINDRGPARRLHRLIDLSYGAFKQIANPKEGVIEVRMEEL